MMNITLKYIIVVFVTLIGYSSSCFSIDFNTYPYTNISIKEVKQPKTVEECILQLDSILKPIAISHFKNLDRSIAEVEISNSYESFFINAWNLNFYQTIDFAHNAPVLVRFFVDQQVKEPKLMVRVIFRCYYKVLNNESFDVSKEINFVRIRFKEIEKPMLNDSKYAEKKWEIRQMEDSLIKSIQFKDYAIGDTIGILFRDKEDSNRFYISGKIIGKDEVTDKLDISIFDITSNRRFENVFFNEQMIFIGDTITSQSFDWVKLGSKKFSYHRCEYTYQMPYWESYIITKFLEDEK